jgi:hypothetical protein
VSGLVVAAVCVGPGGALWSVGAGVGLIVLLWTGLVWRPGGAGQRMRRYVLRRFPKKPVDDVDHRGAVEQSGRRTEPPWV